MVGSAKEHRSHKEPKVEVKICPKLGDTNIALQWLADSWVRRTLLAETDWNRLKKKNPSTRLKSNNIKFTPYGTNVKLPVKGRAKVVFTNARGRKVTSMVYVVGEQTESLLGKKDGQSLGIIQITPRGGEPSTKTREDKEAVHRMTEVKKTTVPKNGIVSGGQTQAQIDGKMTRLLEDFNPLFDGIGKAGIPPIHIYTKEGRAPVAQKQRTVAHQYLEPLKKHLEELLKEDVIEGPLGSEHSTRWVSNVVITANKYDPSEGSEAKSKIRMNLDSRLMEDVVLTTHFPIPTSEQLRHQFLGSDRYSVIDLNHAFHQFEINEESRALFVFTTPFGLYRFKRLVMGTAPASAECHTKLKDLLEGLEEVVQIKDNLVVHGIGQEHDERLRKVLQRMLEAGLTLRREKTKLGQAKVLLFGNIFSKQGMSPDPQKVADIKAWEAPKDKSEVNSFLQTVQFSSTFMRPTGGKTYSDITKPLRDLTKHGVWFKWS